jgi:hypothetical protein
MKFETVCAAAAAATLSAGLVVGCSGGSSSPQASGGAAPTAAGAGGSPASAAGSNPGSSGASASAGTGTGGSYSAAGNGADGGASGAAAVAGSAGAMNSSAGASSGGESSAGSGNTGGSGAGGQPGSSAVAFDNNARVTLTGVRGVTPPTQQTLKLHNGGAAAVQVTGLALSGPNMDLFKVTTPASFPATIAAGADLTVTLQMTTSGGTLPAPKADADARTTGSTMVTAALTATLSAGSAMATVYGLVANVNNYEATLGQILGALGYKLNVGKAQNNWNWNGSDPTTLGGLEAGTDEVAAPHFTKAGAGNVTITLAARFSPKGPLPYGWYSTTTGCPTGCTKVAAMASTADAQTSDTARMVNPPFGTGITSFDPGAGPFGLWVYSDQRSHLYDTGTVTNGDYVYSQDALNAPANVHRFRSYPLKDAAGTAIADSYLIGIEEAGNGDYQDYVFVLGNVKAAP